MDNRHKIEQLRHMIDESRYLVCICEQGMQEEIGYRDYEYSDAAYEIEKKYGHATEEIFNSAFYATRKEQFFEFYRQEILSEEHNPGAGFEALKKLEDCGRLKAVLTTSIYALPERAGCKNVIELHGSIENNECPHCHRRYSLDYIKNQKKVPICQDCGAVIRPGVYLYGEMLDNAVMTHAMQEVEKADVLLICGANLNGKTCSNCVQYFNGDKVVIITDTPHFMDNRASLVIYDRVADVLPQLV